MKPLKIVYKVVINVNGASSSLDTKEVEQVLNTNSYEEAELIMRTIKAVAKVNGKMP